ncbi:MAG: endonuclease/exonuclease/phosphatase family protein [Planctomycetota bacterium]|jgi:endonuclease/exonuclease/phosphatase family metal-dependent hydrolase
MPEAQQRQPPASWIERGACGASWTCALALAIQPCAAGWLPPVTAFHQGRHLVLPLLLPLGLYLLRRRRRAALPALLGFAFWLSFLPGWLRAPQEFTDRSDLGVATANLAKLRSDPHVIGERLAEFDVDVIALQEVEGQHREVLGARLERLFPHQVWYATGLRGKALLSKHPVLSERYVPHSDGSFRLDVSLDVNGRELQVFNVHHRTKVSVMGRWLAGVRELESTLAARPDTPTLVLGDFNSVPGSWTLRGLEDLGLHNADEGLAGDPGSTFPVPGRWRGWPWGPHYRIDHVFHDAHFETLHAEVGPDLSSDHLPLVAYLKLR